LLDARSRRQLHDATSGHSRDVATPQTSGCRDTHRLSPCRHPQPSLAIRRQTMRLLIGIDHFNDSNACHGERYAGDTR